jgi:FkbH-like protein
MTIIKNNKSIKIAIVSSFTAEPINGVLQYWMDLLNIPAEIEFADYNQVLQELHNPSGVLGRNEGGINIILFRLEDFIRYKNDNGADTKDSFNENIDLLKDALHNTASRLSNHHILALCPVEKKKQIFPIETLEEKLCSIVDDLSNIHLVLPEDVSEKYPVDVLFDEISDRLGHISYTLDYFTALGTTIARKIYTLLHSPYKVLALDCDNTLWKGVCGEGEVLITDGYSYLQNFALQKVREGMLLTLCSKNKSEDVISVFKQQHGDMKLSLDDIVTHKINWNSKSSNLYEMAKELNLSTESFVFIDDSPIEYAEVQTNCPSVLCLKLPTAENNISNFINNVWALDSCTAVSDEDAERTELYKRNARRNSAERESVTYSDFIKSLNLVVDVKHIQPGELARASQLTLRTNQFNLSTVRRTEKQLKDEVKAGLECLTVDVSDRFGDYGLVGLILFSIDDKTLNIETFLLSCRTLGRGVEYRMLSKLINIARYKKLEFVQFNYVKSDKNVPIAEWLNKVGKCISTKDDPPTFNPEDIGEVQKNTTELKTISSIQAPSELMNYIAAELNNVPSIRSSIKKSVKKRKNIDGLTFPRDENEKSIALIWCEILEIDSVGIYENFFELGGHSLLMVQVVSRIAEETGIELPMDVFIEDPTIENLAGIISEGIIDTDDDLMDLIGEIDNLSDEEIESMIDTLEKKN